VVVTGAYPETPNVDVARSDCPAGALVGPGGKIPFYNADLLRLEHAQSTDERPPAP
jgi:hypothetical protein